MSSVAHREFDGFLSRVNTINMFVSSCFFPMKNSSYHCLMRSCISVGMIFIASTLFTMMYIHSYQNFDYLAFSDSQFDAKTYRHPSKPGSICCLVLTSPKYLFTRARAINATWGSRCDRLFFITEYFPKNMTLKQKEFAKRMPIAPIDNIQSGYAHLTQKTISAFLFVYKNYVSDFDWFVKADDDTYVIVENLQDFLKQQNTSEPVTFGYNFKVYVSKGYHSGGASYVLSREALRRFNKAHRTPNQTNCRKDGGMEDVEIAKCLRGQGVYAGKSLDKEDREMFHPLSFSSHFQGVFPTWLEKYAENPLKTASESYKKFFYF